MASLNKVCLIGYLGQTPTVQYSREGTAVCHLSLATDESYTSRDGEKVNRTEWHRVNVFGKQAENCGQYLTNCSLVYVEGSLGTRKWQDKDGNDKYSTEVTARIVKFLDRHSYDAAQARRKQEAAPSQKDEPFVSDIDAIFGPRDGGTSLMDRSPF